MRYFFMRLSGPRPTFPADITPEERQTMNVHSAYWADLIKKGKAIIVGPVFDPKGAWGMGVIRVADPTEVQSLLDNDPAILANLGFRNEAFPMPNVLLPEGM